MISAATNMAQLITLIVPGFIMVLITRSYFPLVNDSWNVLINGDGNVTGSIIVFLLFSLSYGIAILSITYTISMKIYEYRAKKINIKLKSIYGKNVSEEVIVSLRNFHNIHQMMFNMFVVGVFGFLSLIFTDTAPDSSSNFLRFLIVAVFIASTGFASWVSSNSIMVLLRLMSKEIKDSDKKVIDL